MMAGVSNLVLCGDALTELKKLPDDCVNCVVTSPPYWGLRDYGVEGMIGLEPTLDEFISNLVAVFREVKRVLHPTGCIFVNMGHSYASSPGQRKETDRAGAKQQTNSASTQTPSRSGNGFKPKDLIPQPWLLGLELQKDGWWLRSEIIWSKLNPMPGSQQDRCTTSHETILMLTKSQRYAFYMDQVREPHKEPWRSTGKMENHGTKDVDGGANQGFGLAGITPRLYNPNGRALRSVWTFATEPMGWQMCVACKTVYAPDEYRRLKGPNNSVIINGEKQPHGWSSGDIETGSQASFEKQCRTCKATDQWLSHFAAFPKELAKRCILASTKPNDVVLDPFAGAFTTGLVARNLGRDYVLIELNPDYVILGETRLKRETQQLRMGNG